MKMYKFFLIKSVIHLTLRKRNFINILLGVSLLLSSSQLLAQTTVIGVAKQASLTTDLGGGLFETTLSFSVENLGDQALNSVQVTDNLDAVFPAPATYSVSAGPTAVGLTGNGGFNGSGVTDLLSGGDTLAIGATATISVTVQFAPNGATGPFNNTAVASGESSVGTPAADTSDDGVDPDPDGDGDPDEPDENDPTPISFIEVPVVGVAKQASVTTSLGGGLFETTLTFIVENLGNVALSSVQLSDDLDSTFSAPATYSVSAGPASAGFTANGGFNGSGDTNLLAGTDTLAIGATATISVTLQFAPNGAAGPFSNTAVASGQSPGGTPTTDTSDDGADPDPDGDGNPDEPGENDSTPIAFIVTTTDLSITKTDGVTSAVPGAGLTYTMVVANAGPDNTSASATVSDTFPAVLQACSWTCVASLGSCSAAGAGAINDTAVDLLNGGTATYTVNCTIDPAAIGGLVSSTATVTAVDSDSDTGNNSATDGDTVLTPLADLAITLDDGVTSAIPGLGLIYTIVASNAGPSDESSATVADSFPSDLSCTYTSVAAGGASGNAASGSGDLSDTLALPSGSSVSYTATCLIDGSATGTLSNTATITASVTDSNPGNNSETDGDTVLEPDSADLSITIADNTGSSTPPFEYRIVASNAGPTDEPSANVSSTFAAGLSCAYTSVAAGGASGNTAGDGDLNDVLSMPVGGSVTYTAICVVDGDATGPFSSSVGIAGSVADPDSANDGSTVVINALPNPSSHNAAPIPVLSNLGLILLSLQLMAIAFMTRHSTFQKK